jgi:NADP-dependent aldehyde dehydrogenase
MPLHGKNFIGHGLSAEGTETFQAVSPLTTEKLDPPFVQVTREEAARALDLAEQAFRNRRRDPAQDAALLDRIAEEIEALGDELIDRAHRETGLPETRIKLERARTTAQLRMFAQVVREGSWVDARIDTGSARRRPIPKPDVRRMLGPIGPVAVFPASNFPLAFSVAGGDTASAFAAGCPVVVKIRPSHPGTSELAAQAIQKAVAAVGLPDGWFSALHGPGRQLGMFLVHHPAIRAVGFTGSLAGGRSLMEAAASRPDPIPIYAEMGSANPVFLLPQALAERGEAIAQGLHQSLTLGVGQFCTCPGLVIALRDERLDAFLATLGALVEATLPGTMLMEPILKAYEKGVRQSARISGVRRLAEARVEANPQKTEARAALLMAEAETILRNPDLRCEIFGPAAMVVRCQQREQLIEIAEALEGQLTATIHATEDELAASADLVSILERKAGRLIFNGFPTNVEVCPAMHHGGPFPATGDVRSTSVGTAAMARFARPLCYQDFPDSQLPPELRNHNARQIWRLIDHAWTRDDVGAKL